MVLADAGPVSKVESRGEVLRRASGGLCSGVVLSCCFSSLSLTGCVTLTLQCPNSWVVQDPVLLPVLWEVLGSGPREGRLGCRKSV